MIKGIYIAWDRMDVPRYVGMSFNDLMQRQRHVNGGRSHNKKLNEYVKANGPLRMEFHDLSHWSYAFRVNRLTPNTLGKFAALPNYDGATIRRGCVL